jgi:hypothetical protein
MFSQFKTPATIKKLSTYTLDKSSYATVSGVTIYGWFNVVSPSMQMISQGVFSQSYEYYCDGSEDVDDGDILTIDGVTYGVRGTSLHTLASISVLKCLLEKKQNE